MKYKMEKFGWPITVVLMLLGASLILGFINETHSSNERNDIVTFQYSLAIKFDAAGSIAIITAIMGLVGTGMWIKNDYTIIKTNWMKTISAIISIIFGIILLAAGGYSVAFGHAMDVNNDQWILNNLNIENILSGLSSASITLGCVSLLMYIPAYREMK